MSLFTTFAFFGVPVAVVCIAFAAMMLDRAVRHREEAEPSIHRAEAEDFGNPDRQTVDDAVQELRTEMDERRAMFIIRPREPAPIYWEAMHGDRDGEAVRVPLTALMRNSSLEVEFAKALVSKGAILRDLGRHAEALAVLENAVGRFEAETVRTRSRKSAANPAQSS